MIFYPVVLILNCFFFKKFVVSFVSDIKSEIPGKQDFPKSFYVIIKINIRSKSSCYFFAHIANKVFKN